ncbi:hypothetical protein D8B26_007858 [Coccidioides posadasii str. Silveira]|uniref:Uncharacterized protein n=2 Tax=Coccidioides posadasii TaxID=199306 RepID=E9D1H9_COCPS|nr:hypothetical protein CPC735_018460 [Coccidioides posadasii C735 delta SOWgp]EER25242.1 hypothetical protein CPC735_018460 [Coccidioides posadasii C735 delta SOWgp]EFW19653.1 conserved hypothetical protein [Coccidioides posadasii str. Silveira]QVM13244.1 hypothetical protein D8B26_007858 [Coccidioides posadasii str. Silveira]|eukprot:XP_003067387.1 hypothetical protein CPC735_018460 [Coccidioides posadasii C735 delta SOWgp]
MSSVPKARRSNVSGLTVTPDKWDYYPSIERSDVKSCSFTNLSSSTHIRHSKLNDVHVLSENGRGSYIERCDLSRCTISDSYIERSRLRDSRASHVGRMDRSTASRSEFVGAQTVERSSFQDSRVGGQTAVSRSEVKKCSLGGGSRVQDSVLDRVSLWDSTADRVVLKNCDVKDCKMSKTNLSGMVLRYGIWNNGDLVGRTSREHEVIATSLEEWNAREERDAEAGEQEGQVNSGDPPHQAVATAPTTSAPVSESRSPLTLHIETQKEIAPPSYTSLHAQEDADVRMRSEREFTPPTPTSDGFSDITELVDNDNTEYKNDARVSEKDGPPPPYEP